MTATRIFISLTMRTVLFIVFGLVTNNYSIYLSLIKTDKISSKKDAHQLICIFFR
ncbi:hypothetical protein [Metabacillus litoralis]|uniref:hypothetical protein n=1 Tax=Metabacillus litoralis TaxID=152268 RepID=UPI001315272F|nr:hypothetical protein [Metabacillus litoralis]